MALVLILKSNFAQILTTNFNSNYCLSTVESLEYPSISTYKSEANNNSSFLKVDDFLLNFERKVRYFTTSLVIGTEMFSLVEKNKKIS